MNKILEDERVIPFPNNLTMEDINAIEKEQILFVFPYCLKNLNCPRGKKSNECDLNCNLCKVSTLIKLIKSKNFDYMCVVSDDELIAFLHGNIDTYHLLIGICCSYSINKYSDFLYSNFKLKGFAINIEGSTCKYEVDFHKYANDGIKIEQTDIDLNLVNQLIYKINK